MPKGAVKKRLIDLDKVYESACAGCTRHGDAPGECYHDEPCERLIFAFTTAEPVEAVVLPCKPGDIVYYMNRYRRKVWPMKITSVEINSQGINEYGCWCDVPESYTPICFQPIAIGKTVFFTQEEAKAALTKMKGGAGNGG